MRAERGFTLTELVITITIGAILAAMAVPSFRDMMADSRITTTTNNLIAQLSLARSEAIKRNQPVVMCRSTNSTAANPTCGGGAAQDWDDGWIVFVNVDGNTPPTFDAGDLLLRAQEPLPGNIQLRSAVLNGARLAFRPDGTSNMGGTSHFAICDDRGEGEGARQVSIGVLGRPETLKDDDGRPLGSGPPAGDITDCDNPVDPP